VHLSIVIPGKRPSILLEGELEILLGNRREVCGAGAVVHIPANAIHAFQICSPSARALVIIAPGEAEAFYREAGAKLIMGNFLAALPLPLSQHYLLVHKAVFVHCNT
jgi:hypothetical protein